MFSVDSRDQSIDLSKGIVHGLLQIDTRKCFSVAVGCALYWKQHVPGGCAASVPQVQRDGAEVAQDQSRGQNACKRIMSGSVIAFTGSPGFAVNARMVKA